MLAQIRTSYSEEKAKDDVDATMGKVEVAPKGDNEFRGFADVTANGQDLRCRLEITVANDESYIWELSRCNQR